MKNSTALVVCVFVIVALFENSNAQWNNRNANAEKQGHVERSEETPVLKVALKAAQQALLEEIESLERSLDQQISELQHRKSQIAMKKRTHRKCMVHLISCYKK